MLGWLVPGDLTPAIDRRWLSFTGADELIAPSLLRAECTSVLTRWVHSGDINAADARLQIERMLRVPIRIVERAVFYSRAFDIARSLGWAKAYDALYLAAAEAEAAELLTLDSGLRDAAARLSIRASLIEG